MNRSPLSIPQALGCVACLAMLEWAPNLSAGPPEAGAGANVGEEQARQGSELSPEERQVVRSLKADVRPTVIRSLIALRPNGVGGEKGDSENESGRGGDRTDGVTDVVGGEGLVLICTLKNSLGAAVSYTVTSPLSSSFKLKVRRRNGEPVPLSGFGRSLMSSGGIIYSRSSRQLAPGSSFEHEVHLSRIYDLSVPGEYEVTFSMPVVDPNGKTVEEMESVPTRFRVLN